jgi:hypothetical protein
MPKNLYCCSAPKPDLSPTYFVNFSSLKKLEPNTNPKRSGVDVMITIFCDFPQFSAKEIGVFLKYQCYDQFFSTFSFVLSQKRQFFR